MKKSVLALAALGAFAGAASAQSSVTIFGVVDLNVMSVDNNERTYSMGTDGMASSRLGFRGVEDLGGGLKAGFWLEMGLAPDTGRNLGVWGNGGTQADGGGNELIFNRRSTVSLSNQWGELRLGRDYTATFWNWTVFDPFGTNGVGSATNLALTGGLQAVGFGQGNLGTFTRANNMVAYILPAGQFGPGFYGQVQAAAGEGATVSNKYYGIRLGWAGSAFDIAGAYGINEITPEVDVNSANLGASWNFGFMKLSGFFAWMEVDGNGPLGNSIDATRENWYIGISAPFGQWNFKASYGGTNSSGNSILADSDASQWAIGADYNLSKRTALYATWASIDNDANANFRVSTQSNVPSPNRGFNSDGIQLGIRHSF